MSVTRGRPIIVAASTHPGEEEILLEAHRTLAGIFPSLLTVIVPRHPDRGVSIARMIAAAGLQPSLRSREELPMAATDIYVADTMGELGLFYRLAPIVFMGGSLVAAWRAESDRGGQARRIDRPWSPRVQFRRRLRGARRRGRRQAGRHARKRWSSSSASCWPIRPRASTCIAASARVVEQLGGALDRTLAALEPYLLQLRLEMGAANA